MNMSREYDVIGIGNALVDFLIELDEEKICYLNLKKGNFHMMSADESKKIIDYLKGHDIKLAPGGSCANTISTIAKLGGKTVFIGKVGDDDHGDFFCQELEKDNVKINISKGPGMTGHAITMITPDTERTFSVHLGESVNIKKNDIIEEDIKKSKIFHIEGYQLDDPDLKQTVLHAMDIAKSNGVIISMDLGDPGLIKRNLKDFKSIVTLYANILFLNEEEARVFTGLDDIDLATEKASMITDIVVVKLGKKGSIIKKGDRIILIEPKIVDAVDTTGAGDNYAAGFLYGITQGLGLEKSGKIANVISAKIVEKIGARFDSDPKELIKDIINSN